MNSITTMKNLLTLILIFGLTAAFAAFGGSHLDAADLFSAASVAALFAIALRDTGLRVRPMPEARPEPVPASEESYAPRHSESFKLAA